MKKITSLVNKLAAAAAIFTMLAPAFVVRADSGSNAKALTEDQKILHVLNRLGFGARPGDVEKVKAIGLQKYIDQQLNASAIDDSAAESKVKNLDIFNMSTAELFAKYPNPGALLQQLEGRNRKSGSESACKRRCRSAGSKRNDAGRAARTPRKDP